MRTKRLGQGLGLRLAEHGIRHGHVDDRAVMLTQLHSQPVVLLDARGVTGIGESLSELVNRAARINIQRLH